MMMTSLLKCKWPMLSHDDADADDSNDVMNDDVMLYVHRNRRLIRDGGPGRPPRL